MLRAAKISFAAMRNSILLFGAINCIIYILLFLLFRLLGWLDVFGISMVNYVTLFFVSMLQFRHQIVRFRGFIPFLEVFFAAMITGTVSFVFFAAFMFAWGFSDPRGVGQYVADAGLPGKVLPFVILFFEGSGGSLIVALAVTFYTARYEDGEVEV